MDIKMFGCCVKQRKQKVIFLLLLGDIFSTENSMKTTNLMFNPLALLIFV